MKKLLLICFLATINFEISFSQIFYHDISPDSTVSTWYAYTIAPSSVSGNYFVLWWHPTPEVIVETDGICEILINPSNSLPAKLNTGDSISATGTWISTINSALNSSGTGNWQTAASDKYLGFRFKNATGSWHYGWLKMSVAPGADSFTVKEWAYNSLDDKSIKAGQTSVNTKIVSTSFDDNVGIINTDKKLRFTNLNGGFKYNVAICGITGQIIQLHEIKSTDLIDLYSLIPGVYVIELQGNGYTKRFKIATP